MVSIKSRFEIEQTKHSELSSFINFCHAIKEQGFSRNSVISWFKKLVEKEDYEKKDLGRLIEHCWELNISVGGRQKRAKRRQFSQEKIKDGKRAIPTRKR